MKLKFVFLFCLSIPGIINSQGKTSFWETVLSQYNEEFFKIFNEKKEFLELLKNIHELPLEMQNLIAQYIVRDNEKFLLHTPTEIHRIALPQERNLKVEMLALSPNGQFVACSRQNSHFIFNSNVLYLWDISQNSLKKINDADVKLTAVSWRSDSQYLATGSSNGLVQVWDCDGNLMEEAQESPITAVCWSPDGTILAYADENGIIKLRDFQVNLVYGGSQRAKVVSLAWNAGSTVLLAGTSDGKIFLWDRKGNPITTMIQNDSGITSFALSPDGTLLVTVDSNQELKLWNKFGKLIKTIGNYYPISSLVWCSNQSFIYQLGGEICDVIIRRDRDNEMINYFYQKTKCPISVNENGKIFAFSADGRTRRSFEDIRLFEFLSISTFSLLTQEELDNLTIDQALFLKLLLSQKSHLDSILTIIHLGIPLSAVTDVLESFSSTTQKALRHYFNLENLEYYVALNIMTPEERYHFLIEQLQKKSLNDALIKQLLKFPINFLGHLEHSGVPSILKFIEDLRNMPHSAHNHQLLTYYLTRIRQIIDNQLLPTGLHTTSRTAAGSL